MTLLISSLIVSGTLFTGIISFSITDSVVRNNSNTMMDVQCQQKISEINAKMEELVRSTNVCLSFAQQFLPNDLFDNEEEQNDYLEIMRLILQNQITNNPDIYTAYFVLNYEEAGTSGVFLTQEEKGQIAKIELTDLSSYTPGNPQVCWYYEPKAAKKPVWLKAYSNEELNSTQMVSYTIPFYKGDVFIGVIGMDLKLEHLINQIKDVKLYETGFAVLSDVDGSIIYHPELEGFINRHEFDAGLVEVSDRLLSHKNEFFTYKSRNGKKRLVNRELTNGMIVAIVVPLSEINKPQYKLAVEFFIALIVILSVSITINGIFLSKNVKQILTITEEAKRIAAGDLNLQMHKVPVVKDEIGELANSIATMNEQMHYYMAKAEQKAMLDPLTGIGNKGAFRSAAEDVLTLYPNNYGVLVMDVNNLKKVNDELGHEEGDRFLLETVKLLKHMLGNTPVYRIGGDEFATPLTEKTTEKATQKKIETYFYQNMSNWNEKHKDFLPWGLWIAVGFAEVNPAAHETFSDVFRRADNNMYENKKQLKEKFSHST
ncbi:MAG: diguanylate cyclase [Treponema sp.]|nr:diguanylate cyclase [Treponema sp.]